MSMAYSSVLVGMSGGIDSTAVCSMLLEQGCRVVGLTFITCDASFEAAKAAASLAESLGIEHHVADIRDSFKTTVIKPFVEGYLSGLTPNPCVNCNVEVKFRLLQEWADKTGCEKIATGHYVKVVTESGISYIVAGDDERKDQSYFLWRLTQEQLKRVVFPLGDWTKNDVRNYLKENNMTTTAEGGESMEVCFIPGDYRDFLRSNVSDIKDRVCNGMFVDSSGKPLGEHQGFPFYTIGQRKGLGVALGYPAYVIKINPEKNTVMLGTEEQLRTRYMLVDAPEWAGGLVPSGDLSVRIRYRSSPIPCSRPMPLPDGRFLVCLSGEASAITPGQSAVFYVGKKVVGGAFISSQRGINQWIECDG